MEFREFDNIEDMLADMRLAENQANQGLAPEQEGVGYGDYWVRFLPDRLVIFGRVMPKDEFINSERALADPDDAEFAEMELAGIIDHHEQSYARGYRFGWCFSTVEPTGEPGSTHIANVWPIDKELYDQAEAVGWNIDALPEDSKLDLEVAYQEYREHALEQGQAR